MDDSSSRPDAKSVSKKPAAPGVRTPFAGESSGSNVPVPPQDGATLADPFPKARDPEATLVDADATIAPGTSFRRTPPPKRSSILPHPLPQDEATLVDAGPRLDPDATLVDADATIAPGTPFRRTPAPPRSRSSDLSASAAVFEIGDVLGGRYEILQLLGEGGMGAVYKATDRELDRFVALKVIRPELASNPSILARFKQELLLAHQVTHRNVIRIYDLGEAEGVKFITMEFIEGRDLRSIIREKNKFAPEEAVEVIQQVCQALDAAHSVGVIHRDLKPQNIMQDGTGRMLVMDFGLARTVEGDGMTQTGAIVGTMEYMSPEQSLGKDLDQRSDIFALGLILYEMLTGKQPFAADSALASLIKRTQQRATPVSDVDAQIPGALSGIVSKCLERDLDQRYQNVSTILADLNTWQDKRAAGTIKLDARVKPWGQTLPWPLLAGIATVLVLAIVGYVFRGPLFSPSAKQAASAPALSLAILPFRNASGDPSVDWLGPSLADMLSTDVGQSAHLRTISPDRLHQVLSDLRITPGTSIDPTMVGRIAEFSNADTLVWGQYARFGGQIRIDATLHDLKHDRNVPIKIEAVDEKDIPGAVDRLASSIRNNLAFSPDVINELKASSFQPSSGSAPALRDYNQGIQFLRDGKNLDAVRAFQSATKEDPEFALAYSRLADADSALGYDGDAEQASRKSVELSQPLPMAEKYLIQATHARVMKDNKKAIEAYETLAKTSPDNNDIQYALGNLYLDVGDLEKARSHYSKVLKADPKNLDALIQTGWLEVESGSPQAGLDPLNRALSLAVEVDNQEQKAQVLQAIGMAYEAMNKFDEALRNLEQARDINLRLGKKAGVANSLVEIANVQRSLGKPEVALAGYTQALNLRREIGAKRDTANTLIAMGVLFGDRGQPDKALQMFKESLQTQRDLGDESNQALCLNNIGSVYYAQGKNDDALTYYQQSLQLREKLGVPADIADTLHNLGEVYFKTAQYDPAMAAYMRALDIRHKSADNHAAAFESDGVGKVFLYQGRIGAAISSLQDAVKGFRETKDRSENMVEFLTDFAKALANAGRGAEAGKILEEAQGLAGELKNNNVMADILNTQGDVLFYRGDFKAAKGLYQQGLQAASRSKAEEGILLSKLNLARVAIAEGQSQAAVSSLRQLAEQANTAGLKYLSIDSSVYMAEAMINGKNYSASLHELEQQLGKSEKLGLRLQSARIQYLLGYALRLSGNAGEAAGHYRQALGLIDDMRKDAGAEKLLERSDLKSMFSEASRFAATQN